MTAKQITPITLYFFIIQFKNYTIKIPYKPLLWITVFTLNIIRSKGQKKSPGLSPGAFQITCSFLVAGIVGVLISGNLVVKLTLTGSTFTNSNRNFTFLFTGFTSIAGSEKCTYPKGKNDKFKICFHISIVWL
jgi:hypothetical protein